MKKIYIAYTEMYCSECSNCKENLIAFYSEDIAKRWVEDRLQEMKDYWDHKIPREKILHWNEGADYEEVELLSS